MCRNPGKLRERLCEFLVLISNRLAMNLLLIYSDELVGNVARLEGARAQWVYETFRLSVGDEIVCGELNKKIGTITIREASRTLVIGEVSFERDAPERIAGELIVGLSRPQTIKKVLHFAASIGMRRLRLVRCERSEKSYLDSHLLRVADLNTELDLGLCQAVDTVRPEVIIHHTLDGCLRDFLAGEFRDAPVKWVGALSITADEAELSKARTIDMPASIAQPFVVAIGPEQGFTPEEIARLQESAQFTCVCLGTRQLRVEFALAALVGRCIPLR